MLSYKELARLRRVRKSLVRMARGAGAASARYQLDEWIAEEKATRERMKEYPPLRPKHPPKPAERMG